MNENIDLTKILKYCPEGTEFWSDNVGKVQFLRINECFYQPILVRRADGAIIYYTKEGWENITFPGSCLLWPSKDCRDWSKFTAPWYKKEKFDPKTLKPFDKVLARDYLHGKWTCGFFSHIVIFDNTYMYNMGEVLYKMCIPYNEETKHLVGTNKEAPEYYRYWED